MSDDASPVRLEIRSLAHGGDGVGEAQGEGGPVWFVPGALPGETVEATAVHTAKRFVRGRLEAVQTPSPDRVTPPCPLADRCGGCQWQHLATGAQAEHKRTIVAEQLRRIVDDDRVELCFEGGAAGYRRRARLHYEGGGAQGSAFVLGFRAAGAHDVVDQTHCPVLAPALDRAVQEARALQPILPDSGELVALTDGTHVVVGLPAVRPTAAVASAAQALIDRSEAIVGIEVRGGRERAAYGRRTLDLDGVDGMPPLRVGPFAFVQAQAAGARALVRHVTRMARPDGVRILELFAGVGTFTRALARHGSRVWASDTDRDAVDTLRALTTAHDLSINARKQNAARLLGKLAERAERYDVVVLDPPRAGLGEAATRALARVAAQRIVYVSCDPATLARDLAEAKSAGFDVVHVGVFDLMPMTSQIEVVATLTRGKPGFAGREQRVGPGGQLEKEGGRG